MPEIKFSPGTPSQKTVAAGTPIVVGTAGKASLLVFCAPAANTGVVYIGGSTVAATRCIPLAAGEKVSLDFDSLPADKRYGYTNPADWWIDGSVSGDKVNVFPIISNSPGQP